MTPNAKRLLASVQQAGRRRTMRWHRHHAGMSTNRAGDAANELLQGGAVRAFTQGGNPVLRVNGEVDGLLLEIKVGSEEC